MTWFQADKENAMKKGATVFIFCLIILLAGLFPSAGSAEQDIPTFSNKDLERYKSPSDETTVPAAAQKVEKPRKTRKDEQREKNYWCSRARSYQKKIDRAKEKVKEVEQLASDESGGQAFTESRLKKPTRKKYEKAKKELKEAERELQYLEEDAHRKDIPPGWLRCQFE
jgi:FtsZ-interacting cell division protein ZipA